MTPFAKTVLNEDPIREEKLKNPGKSGARLVRYKNGIRAVVKHATHRLPNGKTRQRGIPVRTHPYREVAFYNMAKLLGWSDLVAETVLVRRNGKTYSAQLYTPSMHLPDIEPKLEDVSRPDWMFILRDACLQMSIEDWRRVVILDLINGSRDRHVNGAGVTLKLDGNKAIYHPLLWDNAVSGGLTFDRYYSVFHRALFSRAINLDPFLDQLSIIKLADVQHVTAGLWNSEEQSHAWQRIRFILRYPYRIPWSMMSKGIDDKDEFPDYADWFKPLTVIQSPGSLVTTA